MDELRDRIAAVIRKHPLCHRMERGRPVTDNFDPIAKALHDLYLPMSLGYVDAHHTEKWENESEPCKNAYRNDAAALAKALGLQVQVAGPDGIAGTGNYRYVTDFFEPEADQ